MFIAVLRRGFGWVGFKVLSICSLIYIASAVPAVVATRAIRSKSLKTKLK
jgi:hypothetical protein